MRNSIAQIGAIVAFCAVTTSPAGAQEVERVQVGGVSIAYSKKPVLKYAFFVTPKIRVSASDSEFDYAALVQKEHELRGWVALDAKESPNLFINETYAGDIAGYSPPTAVEKKTNWAEAAFNVGVAAIFASFGQFSANQVGSGVAANAIVNQGGAVIEGLAPRPQGAVAANEGVAMNSTQKARGDVVVVVACNALGGAKGCTWSSAQASSPDITIDQLREINIKEGLVRALGLGPVLTPAKN